MKKQFFIGFGVGLMAYMFELGKMLSEHPSWLAVAVLTSIVVISEWIGWQTRKRSNAKREKYLLVEGASPKV